MPLPYYALAPMALAHMLLSLFASCSRPNAPITPALYAPAHNT